MADTKISALSAIAALAAEDLYAVVDDPAGTPVTTKATHTQLATLMKSLLISDTAYDATSWNAVTDVAPSKNAVRDQIEALVALLASDTAYASSWNGVTTIPPSKNAVYDKIEALWHPGFVASNYYILNAGATGTGVAIGSSTIGYAPFILPRAITVSSLGAYVRTISAGGNFKVAIYANGITSSQNRPNGTPLAETGNIVTDTAANVVADITGSDVTLQPWTVYWAAFRIDNATAALQFSIPALSPMSLIVGTATLANVSAANNLFLALTSAEAYANAWPDATSETFTEVAASGQTYSVGLIGLAA